jgi:hypothetical protein
MLTLTDRWYRVMSPRIDAYVQSVGAFSLRPSRILRDSTELRSVISSVYDKERNILLLDVFQTFHIRLSPLKPSQSRYVLLAFKSLENNAKLISE